MPAANSPAEMVVMARIAVPFGIKGWVKLQVFTEYADSLDAFDSWYLSTPAGWEAVEVEDFAVHTNAVVAKLKGCDDRTAAERLRRRDIGVPREWLTEAAEDEYLWVDLIGSEVVNETGEALGRVADLMETGANDVLVVKSGSKEILIPFVSAYLVKVDREAKSITVRWQRDWEQDN